MEKSNEKKDKEKIHKQWDDIQFLFYHEKKLDLLVELHVRIKMFNRIIFFEFKP